MKANTKQALYWSLAFLGVGLITPSVIILSLEVLVGHINPLIAIADILRRQFAKGHNLFLFAAFGLIPFTVLSMACFLAARRLASSRLKCVALGGLIGILAIMVPGHIAVWYPLYDSGHMSSTAVIAFLFIPFCCIVSLCVGLLVGWLVSLLPVFRHAINCERPGT